MEKNKKILSIGDIHGRSVWKDKLFGSVLNFEKWARGEFREEKDEYESDYPLHQWDKIIFVGDYVDSFDVSNVEMLQNLKDIILLKKMCPEKIVLLIGNHDIQYIVPDQYCSGYRPEMKHDFGSLYNENASLFQMAYYQEVPVHADRKNRKILWTHAGVTNGWLNVLNTNCFMNENHRHYEILKDFANSRIDHKLNLAWEIRLNVLFLIDSFSGGTSQWASPLWCRPNVLKREALSGFDQIVGHTPKRTITKIFVERESNLNDTEETDILVITDCLEYGDGTFYEIKYEE
jgi:hypothetical protein